MSSGYGQPGAGDPYWFEWYVGLDYVISMLAGNSDIESVTFQEAGLEGVDDVVVRRSRGLPMLCVQVKHKKMTTSGTNNLTFGALVSAGSEGEGSEKSLLASLAAGWKQIADEEEANPEIVLYTNREIGSNRRNAVYRGRSYRRLPLGQFWDIVSAQLETATLFADVVFRDPDLDTQWHELADSTKLSEEDIVPFLKSLTIEAGAPSLHDKEIELTNRLKDEVCAGHQEVASRAFVQLTAELRKWSTAAGGNKVTVDIARECVCKLNRNPLERPIEVPLPVPVFPSRDRVCLDLCERLKSSRSKVVFLQGCPGSGKTRLVSCLCDRMTPRPIRFYAFKPLDVDDFSYSPDAGIVSPKELWSTLLNQLRDMPELSGDKPQIPIINEICSDDELRKETLRLAEALSKERGSKTVLVIDGIDHAARAMGNLTFLKHLPSPGSIPEGVQILVSGQPANLYSSYPQWLKGKHDGVDVVNLPNLDIEDISMLLTEKTNFSIRDIHVLANEIINMTKGNTLSVVYAVHAVADETNCNCAVEKLKSSGLSENIEEYYESIWKKANSEIQQQHGAGSNALDIIASSMHLLDGAIYPELLCRAFPDVFSGKHVATQDISILSPLMRICADGSARPIHNDFRLFMSSKALRPGMEEYLAHASNTLADAVLAMEGDVVRSCYSIRLLAASGRTEECIDLFDTSYVINAVAHGVSWRDLREQAKTVYRMACESRKLENVFRIQLALSTLSQINEHFEYWLEHRPFLHIEELVGMDYMVPSFSKETAALYAAALGRCLWLLKDAGHVEQSDELYGIWFSGLTPLKAAEMLSDSDEDSERYPQEDDSTMLMAAWGEFMAARGLDCDELSKSPSATYDAENLLYSYRDAYMRGILKWCQSEDDIATKISGIPITKDAAISMMRDVLTGALPASHAARCAFFSRLSSRSFEQALGTLAYALCLSEGLPVPDVDRTRPLLEVREGGVYEDGFTLGLFAESFIFGYESDRDGFGSMMLDMQKAIAWIDNSHREYLSFIRALRASACLGYSVGHDEAVRPGTREACVFKEWIRAPSWPGSLTMETCAVPYMIFVSSKGVANIERALEEKELEPFVFSSKPLCVKLRILEHLQKSGSDIPGKYLQEKYGSDGSTLLVSQDAAETHGLLRPLLSVCNRELALHCDEAILFGSARFTDHKDYSLSNLIDIFGALFDLGVATELQAYDLLELDNAATWSGDNRMSDTLMKVVVDWAVSKGPAQLSRIRSCQSEYKYDYALIEFQLRSLLTCAECLDDVLAVFAGLLGHATCCSPKDLDNLRSCLEICDRRAIDLGCESDFADAVSDIEFAIESAPAHKLFSPNTRKTSEEDHRAFEALADEEVEKAAFYQAVDRWHWEPVAEACSELAKRGFAKGDICNRLVETRAATLAREGWTHSSASLTNLVDDIASYADDAAYFKLLSYKNEELDGYGIGSASNDIAHAIMVRARAKAPSLFGPMFELERDSKRKWVTCNGKCKLPVMKRENPDLPEPESLPEIVTDILLDSVIAQDPHRTENAVRGIVWGGLRVKEMRSRVCRAVRSFDPYERILLEKVLDRWMCACPEDEEIVGCLLGLIGGLDRADEACVLSIVAGAPDLILRSDAKSPKPLENGRSKIPSRIRDFLSEAQVFCDDSCADIRDAIESCREGETMAFIRRYMHNDDTLLPTCRLDDYGQELLYAEMCRGRWQNIPNFVTASKLVDPADVWAFSGLPVAKDPSVFGVSRAIDLFEEGDVANAETLVESLPVRELGEGEMCLGWKLYIPYGDQEEYEYYGAARIAPPDCKNPDNVIDREFGCYGLLSAGSGGRASFFSQNSLSLCNALAGCITMTFCDCQIFPSFTMRKLGFEPRVDNPLIWVDEAGDRVARFEQFSFPIEKGFRSSAYYRQPRLWRWVCDERILQRAFAKNRVRVYWATESSNHVDQIKDRHDMIEFNEKKSPFEKELEQ